MIILFLQVFQVMGEQRKNKKQQETALSCRIDWKGTPGNDGRKSGKYLCQRSLSADGGVCEKIRGNKSLF